MSTPWSAAMATLSALAARSANPVVAEIGRDVASGAVGATHVVRTDAYDERLRPGLCTALDGWLALSDTERERQVMAADEVLAWLVAAVNEHADELVGRDPA